MAQWIRPLDSWKRSQPRIREANKLRRKKPNNTILDAPEEMREIYRQLRALSREKYFIEQRIASLASKIQVVIGNNGGMKEVPSWEWAERWTIDKERFEREQPTLYEVYKRDSGSRKFLLARVDLTIGD